MLYCTDTDLLSFEPWIFRDAAFASQLLSSGSGALAGSDFVRSAGSFLDDHVIPGNVLTLAGDLAGCYPIVAVTSATELVASTLHEQLYADDGTINASPIGAGSGLAFSVRTFAPQRQIASEIIRAAAGIGPGTRYPDARLLSDPALRHAAVLGTFQLIYSALAAAAVENADLSRRADYYERLYRRALPRLRVEVDLDGDGAADLVRPLNTIILTRI